mmetsp:Transcript_30281/g.34518  ORF Transcript_30281/g.34518 Transcript_30281/m.34518 type:complete len:242 (+) Transcript_30281:269-994(+)|eukprot:CAMPEP_0194153258 /NCGR_PEP_ID=MMETSP0152-20130528/55769_1 /TAXON_ID=1049557 /ORGANISM="Thalassiothrix antarctica, Strain L6-D1" /LENGTH=241 /DNA_ID=CAMNT_0038858415 /DNA_START=68 /DNA_END=793 /DNA_ORIENTATION=+
MSTPSICGSFIGSKKALLAFTWSITTLLTLVAFLMAIAMMIQINSHYRYLQRINEDNYSGGDEDEEQHSGDEEEYNIYPILARTSSGAMTFVASYTMILAIVLSVYGSTAIVGFTNIQGVYIAPCFPHRNKLKIGMFGGAVVVFANLLLLNAVIFGEIRVEDYRDQEEEEVEPYAIERIATVLAVTCMFLSALYAVFAILLFLSYASDNPSQNNHSEGDDPRAKPLTNDHRHQQFITIETT